MYKLDLGYVRFLQAEDKCKLSKIVLIIGDLYNLLPLTTLSGSLS